ncbi:MAG: TetR/AcrR family transcriptional regulator [Deltaproteobacteria bacterium]|nr:TetR/AcrR family transcriptional regulator [Deltaproteobacteria bacterium]
MSLKEEIVHESLKLFSIKGYEGTSVNDILETVGTSKGGFYNHFKSKEDLYRAVLKEARRIWRERCLYGLDEGPDNPIDRLKRLLENYRERYLKLSETFPGGCIFVNLSVELNGSRPDLVNDIAEKFTKLKLMILRYLQEAQSRSLIRKNVDTTDMSEIIFSAMIGASVLYRADKSHERLDRIMASIDHAIDGLLEKGAWSPPAPAKGQ